MRRFLLCSCVPLLLASAAAAAEGSGFGVRAFIGLWEGIDPVDGGNAVRSITCQRDRSCELRVTDTVFTLCGGGPAFASGTGGLEGGELVFPDVVLTCPGDGPTAHLSVRFARDPRNRTLVETAVLLEEDRELPQIIHHKISR